MLFSHSRCHFDETRKEEKIKLKPHITSMTSACQASTKITKIKRHLKKRHYYWSVTPWSMGVHKNEVTFVNPDYYLLSLCIDIMNDLICFAFFTTLPDCRFILAAFSNCFTSRFSHEFFEDNPSQLKKVIFLYIFSNRLGSGLPSRTIPSLRVSWTTTQLLIIEVISFRIHKPRHDPSSLVGLCILPLWSPKLMLDSFLSSCDRHKLNGYNGWSLI